MTAVSRILAIVCGWLLLGLSLLVSADVILRKFFGFSFQGVDEIGGYVLAVASAVGFSYALTTKAHIRIDILSSRFPLRIQAILDIFSFVLLIGFAGLLAWRGLAVALYSFQIQAIAPTPLGTPLIVPQLLWASGLALFVVCACMYLIYGLQSALKGRWTDVITTLGSTTLEEEIEAEVVDIKSRNVDRR